MSHGWNLKVLTQEEFDGLSGYEKINVCHIRDSIIYYYPEPERHVNQSKDANVTPDFVNQANVALRDICKGEELSIPEEIIEDFYGSVFHRKRAI